MKPRPFPLNHQSMRIIHGNLSHLMAIPILLVFFVGCSGLSREKQPPLDAAARAEAQAVLATLSSHNAGLNNFKGKGKITVRQRDGCSLRKRYIGSGLKPAKSVSY